MMLFTNAQLVLPGALLHGTVALSGALIGDVQPGTSAAPGALDLDGDYLIPGVVDLHTDNLERQVQPRTNARWPSRSAMLAHDAQCAAAGVTTVLDALCLGDLNQQTERVRTFHDGVADLDALADTGLLKAEHFLHLRCELPAPEMMPLLDPVAEHARVRMVSLMDHTPGCGQNADFDRYRALRRTEGVGSATSSSGASPSCWISARACAARTARRCWRGCATSPWRSQATMTARRTRLPRTGRTASPSRSSRSRSRRRSRRGRSTCPSSPARRTWSAAARTPATWRRPSWCARARWTCLASDYVPASLVEAAFGAVAEGITLPEAVALVTANPARLAGLADRGRIAPGLRADLVRVRVHEGLPVVRQVWRAGERVA